VGEAAKVAGVAAEVEGTSARGALRACAREPIRADQPASLATVEWCTAMVLAIAASPSTRKASAP
jgi:hypothetical protein